MTINKNIIGGGYNLLNENLDEEKLTDRQLDEIKSIGTCLIVSANKNAIPHATIVEPSKFDKSEIIIPIVQMITTINNIKENNNIFIHFTRENTDNYEDIAQYKIDAKATLEYTGKTFEEVKHFEETERLPEGWKVTGIVRARLINVEEVVG